MANISTNAVLVTPKSNALDDAAAVRLWALSEQLLAERKLASV